jgi:membrane-bound lytic murein transglycosylase B
MVALRFAAPRLSWQISGAMIEGAAVSHAIRTRIFIVAALLFLGLGNAEAASKEFAQWLTDLKEEARADGISQATLDRAFKGVVPIPRVIELDRRQTEFTLTFDRYLEIAMPPARINRGRQLLADNQQLLSEIEARYGVEAQYLVALWGMESGFGQNMGNFSVIAALSTLAYDGRRSAFFRKELLHALHILDEGHIKPEAMKGSWAGAMGQNQFMPSSFVNNAVDFDGDGKRDIWSTTADVLASAANYLARSGWKTGQAWGRRVLLPEGFDLSLANPDTRKPPGEWASLGVQRVDGGELSEDDMAGEAALVMPAGQDGAAFLAYDNFRVIMKWNRAVFFATAAGLLADRIAER